MEKRRYNNAVNDIHKDSSARKRSVGWDTWYSRRPEKGKWRLDGMGWSESGKRRRRDGITGGKVHRDMPYVVFISLILRLFCRGPRTYFSLADTLNCFLLLILFFFVFSWTVVPQFRQSLRRTSDLVTAHVNRSS